MSYNGWSNYETWRINLECVDGLTLQDMGLSPGDGSVAIAAALENMVDELVLGQAKGFALDCCRSFLSQVDWREIADHMIADEPEEEV